MSTSKMKLKALLGLPAAAAGITFASLMLAAGLVSSLPRPMQGESVRVPWIGCMIASLGLSILLPWLASWPLLRQPRMKGYFLLCLIVTVAAWWLFGFDDLLSKANRRGL
jgi:hypothetical protein